MTKFSELRLRQDIERLEQRLDALRAATVVVMTAAAEVLFERRAHSGAVDLAVFRESARKRAAVLNEAVQFEVETLTAPQTLWTSDVDPHELPERFRSRPP